MKILVVGDLHGSKPKIHFKEFDCIVQPGDFCSDKLLRNFYKKYFKHLKDNPYNKRLNFGDFMDLQIGEKKYNRLIKEQMKEGRKVLKYLSSFGKPIFVIPGNWDNSYGKTRIKDMDKNDYNHDRVWIDWWLGKEINPELKKGINNIYDCQFNSHEFRGVSFIGYGNVSGPEKFSERLKKSNYTKNQKKILKIKIKELYSRLENLFKKNKKFPIIYLSHNVPYKIMDKIKDKNSFAYGKHAGSTVSREMIEKFQPVLCIGGHIHEYHGKKKLGKTIVINAGFGPRANTLIDFDEKKGKVKKVEFFPKLSKK